MSETDLIYNFIVNNEKFERLEQKQKIFNPFRVLKIFHHEIRHSNVLAWLLNPSEYHNLGDRVLKKIIMNILLVSANQDVIPEDIMLKDVHFSNYMDAEVLREKDNIDLLIISESNKFVLLIENKIYSKESESQLKRYLNKTRDNYKDYKILPVFLTIDQQEPKGAKYCVLNHFSVYDIVNNTIELFQDNMSVDTYNFIEYYLITLRDILNMDEDTKKLCRQIYQEHKEAIDLIYHTGNELDITTSIGEFKKSVEDEIEITDQKPRWFMFSIPSFFKIPKMNMGWGNGHPASFWFSEYDGSLKMVLEIGPFDIPEQRSKFLEHLEKKGIPISHRAKEIGRQFTRICTDTVKIKDWHDKDEVLDKMLELYSSRSLRSQQH
ncbi:PD-(D/E)XK nuclease family protein [candidate division KSB1 bacterium]